MKIPDLQCQIKISFCICDHRFFCKWKLPVLLPESVGGELCTNYDFGSWKKKKSFFIPFNHWEGKAVVRAHMTNVWQACFSCVKSGGTEIIYGAREDKETFPHKKVGGRCPQVPEWEPVTGWHNVVGNCWAESAFSQRCYVCGVFFLLHFYGSLFLMNGILTFSLVEQDSIFFSAFQASFAPSSCLSSPRPPRPR